MTHTIPVTLNFYFTDDDMENIIVTALEGGIEYWACLDNDRPEWASKPKDVPTSVWAWKIISDGFGELHFTDVDDEGEYTLTLADLYSGIGKMLDQDEWDGDMDAMDAVLADEIIQYAIFGEVIYG